MKPETVSKHISEMKKGDGIFTNNDVIIASSDAYVTKTDNGREWNFESDDDYYYASGFCGGLVDVIANGNIKSCFVTVPYVSVWDGGIAVETTASVNIRTGEVTNVTVSNVDGLDSCEREYIVMNDEQVDVHHDERGYDLWVDLRTDDALHNRLTEDVKAYVASVITEYHSRMPVSFYDDIVSDVAECSAYDEGYYSDSDIRLAFQRVIAEKFGVEI